MDFNLGQLRCGRPSHDSVRDPMETACYDFWIACTLPTTG